MERLREIDRDYLSKGGCLIGIQTFSKSGKIPGIQETPGTHFLNSFVASVTELSIRKQATLRLVTIGGRFPRCSMVLEFVDPGRLQIAKLEPIVEMDTDEQRFKLVQVDVKGTQQKILEISIQLSLRDTEKEFARTELVLICEQQGISRATVDRWVKKMKDSGSVKSSERYGFYSLHPKPEDPDVLNLN